MKIEILPSLLAGDFGNLRESARQAESAGGDALHLDIMDAHFVPNLSMGPDVVAMARRSVEMPLSVHLMMSRPDQYLKRFIEAGADSLLIHIEAECDAVESLERIRELGARPGITLNPGTPADVLFPLLESVDEILCMTVQPGYGGQSFISEVLSKIRLLRDRCKRLGRETTLLVDGGITCETAAECAAHGANGFIVGTTLYRAADMAAEVDRMRRVAARAFVL
jgi:ribulose-phosphate 3-epimerase